MTGQFKSNSERVSGMSKDKKDFAAKSLQDGHSVLEELGLNNAAFGVHMDGTQSQLESLGSGSAQLEAIVKVTNRPPMIVRNNKVELISLPSSDFQNDVDVKIQAVSPMLGSIGRIEFVNHDMKWGGTGWVINVQDGTSDIHIVTNRHVAKLVARRTAFGSGAFLFDPFGAGRYGAQIDFNEEVDSLPGQARVAKILKFTYLAADDAADIAIARIETSDHLSIEALPLSQDDGKDGDRIAVVGYPGFDSRHDKTELEKYFKGLFDIKRFSPGILQVHSGASRLTHDATTLKGNSGSPIISLENKKVIGLHFAGLYGVGNSAVRVSTLKKVLSGDTHHVTEGATAIAGEQEGRDGNHGPEDLTNRTGYDPDFLNGLKAPLPDVSGVENVQLAVPLDATDDRPNELRYQHFGVLYCTKYKSPVVTAVNIDGEKSKRFKRGSDRWFYDLRIDKDVQVGSEIYSDAGVDRGHMVKREDPNWGEDLAIVKRANFDTFHFTNCSPQHSRFNRNIQSWRGLEDYILNNSRTAGFKASVFSGPILNDGIDHIEELDLFLPREYWKVVIMLTKDDTQTTKLHATAYLLSQGQLIQKLLQDRKQNEAVEGFSFGQYKTFQIAIRDLQVETGIDFGNLSQFDPFIKGDEESGTLRYQMIGDVNQIVL